MRETIKHYRDLIVYQRAFKAAMAIFEVTKEFSADESFSLVDQIRRASRSVCANIAQGWRKPKFQAVFKNKMTDSMHNSMEHKSEKFCF